MMKTLVIALLAGALLAGCASRPVAPATAEYRNTPAAAVADLAKSLAGQAPQARGVIPVAEFTDEASAEVVASSAMLQVQLVDALRRIIPAGQFQPLAASNVAGAKYVILASHAIVDAPGKKGQWVRLRIALTEIATGKRVAIAEAFLQHTQQTFSAEPTRFFKDAPAFFLDRFHLANIDALAGRTEKPLAATISTKAAFNEAISAYEKSDFVAAEKSFRLVLSSTPDHQGAMSGVYQSLWAQSKKAEAEAAFGKLAEAGVDGGKVSVKLLFKVASTDFYTNAEQYRVWQKGLAQAVISKNKCFDVVGHASKSGGEAFNEKLSLQRAQKIVSNMQQLVPGSAGRLKAAGKGAAQNIVGTGSDDAADAVDRRVEFAVRNCSN